MRPLRLALLALLLPLSAAAQRPERLFYFVDRPESWASLRAHIDQIDVVAPGAYSVDADGFVWGQLDPRVLQLAREHHVRVMPLIVNPGFDQEMLHRLLASDGARARAIATLADECRRNGYWGIQFDFENLGFADRDAFSRFFRESADALHRAGCKLSVAVVHRTSQEPGPTAYHKWLFKNWRAGYDLAALARDGDFISVMTYSQHTRRTPPGPQAGIPWVEDVVSYFLRFVPPEKLSLGIPTGSQHWYTSQEERIVPELARSYSEQLSYAAARDLLSRFDAPILWDEQAAVPYAHFSRAGTWEWVFLEDARSFRAKLDLMERHHLRGFSTWVLGPEDPAIWEALPARR